MMGERVGYAPGVFDLFHVGHLNILRRAREHCDRLIAGVCSDELVVRLKGRPPVVPLAERLEIVRSVRYVDGTFVALVNDKIEAWRQLGFDVIFKGDDWLGTDVWTSLETELTKIGVDVVYFPYTAHTSSTLLRDALRVLAPRDPSGPEILSPAAEVSARRSLPD
ncbi:adenylyltransferase/cytidyltransferase family protein [Streptomyces sp. NPDC006393]|uniref:adenylyltransferase/cytidyltransferase family protein n=1 Tax=Streptomyces sp. NPDC006393 TaxID=3156763 RepID=UPI0033DBB8CF